MNLSGIKIKGGYFNTKQSFELFKDPTSKATIIYGKNGSGKSSISRAIYEKYMFALKPNNPNFNNEFSEIEFLEFNSVDPAIHKNIDESTIQSMNIFIYNENFIKENVEFKEDGLDTIVMLGEQKEIEKERQTTKKLIEEKLKLYDDQKSKLDYLKDKTNPHSPISILNVITNRLQERWSPTQSDIDVKKINTKVNDKLINTLLSHVESTKSSKDLQIALDEKLKLLNDLRLLKPLHKLNTFPINSELYLPFQLLEKKIKEPTLTENEKIILNLIQKSNSDTLNQSKSLMIDSEKNNCPVCYQPIHQEHKKDVLSVIEKLLQTEEANNHIKELNNIKILKIELDLEIYSGIVDKNLLSNTSLLINDYMSEISTLERSISAKKINPYAPIILMPSLDKKVAKINTNIHDINKNIDLFNSKFEKINQFIHEASELNLNLAFKEVKDILNLLKKQRDHVIFLEENLKRIVDEGIELRSKLNEIEAKLSNVHIACEAINDYIKYIFFDSNRIKLEATDSYYIVKCRGENVKLSSLSTGERNAISLCYFFAQLFKGKSIQDVFREECLLVIDDPISSFDFENKIGVYSFLRFLLSELHTSNPNSKSIMFTHDLESFQHFQKIYSDMNLKKLGTYQLINQKLSLVNLKSFNEYSSLLQNIYDFAENDDNRELFQHTIGNTLRRVLEAFSTFNYKVCIEELSTNSNVLNIINPPELRNHFKNSMYRLVLNSESHLEERTRGIVDRNFVEAISIEEKIKTCQSILVLLYSLNPLHVEKHLNTGNDSPSLIAEKIKTIQAWKDSISPVSVGT